MQNQDSLTYGSVCYHDYLKALNTTISKIILVIVVILVEISLAQKRSWPLLTYLACDEPRSSPLTLFTLVYFFLLKIPFAPGTLFTAFGLMDSLILNILLATTSLIST